MSFFLDKLLSIFIFPLGFAIFASLLLLMLGALGWKKLSTVSLWIVLLGLWLVSTPMFAAYALRTLEQDFPLRSIKDTPTAEVAIVLGGGVRAPNSDNPYPDFGDSSDRLVHALRLWRAGKVQKVMLVGGGNGWGSVVGSEGGAMASVLKDFGIGAEALVIEAKSHNTFENAVFAKNIWDREQFKSGLLITSASHMRRANGAFIKQGFTNLKPIPIDARAGALVTQPPMVWLPDVRALEQSTNAITEWIGLFVYKVRGQV
jgi:uncharacterized SAM-binding protein YcdF (DUF218 family)